MSIEQPQALYQQIATILRNQIESGQLEPGSTLEPESSLAARFKVDRYTINRAVRSLRIAGLVRVERGNRTIVRELPVLTRDAARRMQIRAANGARGAFDAELALLGLEARTETGVSQVPPPADVAAILGTDPGEPALTRSRRMYAGNIPVQLATSWIHLDIAAGTQLMEVDTGPGGSYSRLADLGHAPAEFTETVSLRLPGDGERAWLRMDAEQRVYSIRRVASDAVSEIEVTDTVLPAHQWRLVYTWPASQ